MIPSVVDAQVETVANAYREGWERIQEELAQVVQNPTQFRRERRLREVSARVERELARLNDGALPRASETVRFAGAVGHGTGSTAAGAVSVGWDLMDTASVDRVANGLYWDLLGATENVDRTTKRFLRAVNRDTQLDRLITGRTADQAARRMAQISQENGVYAVRYANGARHGLAEYASMAVRTVSGEVYNDTFLNGAATEGVEWFECFDGPDCGLESHNEGDVADGLIVDARTAHTYLLSHPNCRRSWGARPDVQSQDQALRTGRSTDLATRDDQIAADVARGMPMSVRGMEAAQPQVRGRRPAVSDSRGWRARRDQARGLHGV